MTFLPIVDRELRTRSRKTSTVWLRAVAAGCGILIAGGMLMMHGLAAGRGQMLGSVLFTTLSWMAFGYCLLEGVRNTADCLSEEKRDGTLGLLFLTDLRGYDVVLGKLAAASLNSFYALLAALPVLGLAILLGGVTGGEFWRMALVLTNTLWAALVCGILASSLSRRQGQAWAAAFGLLVAWFAGPPLLLGLFNLVALALKFAATDDGLALRVQQVVRAAGGWISLASPVMTFSSAFATSYARSASSFWMSLMFSQGLGWLGVALASRILPRWWQEVPTAAAEPASPQTTPLLRVSESPAQTARRARLREGNPVVWLTLRNRDQQVGVWALAVAGIAAATVTAFLPHEVGLMAGGWLVLPFEFAFKVWVAITACRLFAEARRTGALELLLATPLTSQEIVRGQVMAIREVFLGPVVALAGAYAVFVLLPVWYSAIGQQHDLRSVFFMALFGLNHPVSFVTSLIAITLVGMRLALSLKKPGQAAGLTILLVVLAPAFVLCVPNVVAHICFIFWAKAKLDQDLRRTVAQELVFRSAG